MRETKDPDFSEVEEMKVYRPTKEEFTNPI
jgi:hypothetical protein